MSLKDLSKELKKQLTIAEERRRENERRDSMGFGLLIDAAVIGSLGRVIKAVEEAEKNDG